MTLISRIFTDQES